MVVEEGSREGWPKIQKCQPRRLQNLLRTKYVERKEIPLAEEFINVMVSFLCMLISTSFVS